jgi:ribose-phosphate pyrophosphokinase
VSAVVLGLPGNDPLAAALATRLRAEPGACTLRPFPDGEAYVRILTPVASREVVLACTLDRPDTKVLQLLLLAATARDLGATRVGLVAPYLAYMRQDHRFQPGEGVTSAYFGRLLSAVLDWLVAVDAGLHRHASLAAVYTIPALALRAASLLAAWIRTEVAAPVLVGPDVESAQWVAEAASAADLPYLVLEKTRHGDRDVEIAVPGIRRWPGRTPVLLDDIVSTGGTMAATIAHLRRLGTPPPVCVAVHAVFAGRAHEELLAAGAARVVTTNTIPHASNAIDVRELLADGVRRMLHGDG